MGVQFLHRLHKEISTQRVSESTNDESPMTKSAIEGGSESCPVSKRERVTKPLAQACQDPENKLRLLPRMVPSTRPHRKSDIRTSSINGTRNDRL